MDAANEALGLSREVIVDPLLIEGGIPSFFRAPETFKVAIPGQMFPTSLVSPIGRP